MTVDREQPRRDAAGLIDCPRCERQRYYVGACHLCGNQGVLDENGERLPGPEVAYPVRASGPGNLLDHDQIRKDAGPPTRYWSDPEETARYYARRCLALLAELERVERLMYHYQSLLGERGLL